MNNTPETESHEQDSKDEKKDHNRSIKDYIRQAVSKIFHYIYNKIRSYAKTNKPYDVEKEKRSKKYNRRFQNWGVVLSLVMIIVFGFSIWYQGGMTKRALDLAGSANANSEKVLNNQIEISRTDLRPYLCLDFQETATHTSKPKIGIYSQYLVIKNFGKTPAFDLFIQSAIRFRSDFNKEKFPDMGDSIKEGKPMMPPGITLAIDVGFSKKDTINEKILCDINNGAKTIFLFVMLNYTQHIGKSKIDHTTRFCLCYDPQIGTIAPYSGVDVTRKGFDFDK